MLCAMCNKKPTNQITVNHHDGKTVTTQWCDSDHFEKAKDGVRLALVLDKIKSAELTNV